MSVQNVNISTNNVVVGNMILSIINENNKKWKFFKLFLFIILNLF